MLTASERGESMTILVRMKGLTVNAVVDTAAQVTVISRKLADRLALPYMQGVPLSGAAESSTFKAWKSIGVPMRIASESWHWTVYIAEITDDLILRLDLLKYMHAVVDLASNTVVVGSEILEANTR